MSQTAVFALLCATAVATLASPSFADVMVRIAPPAPIIEAPPPPPPTPGYVWRRGFWRWDGVRYVWVPGGYVVVPRRHAVWVEGRWVPSPRGWVWREGHWR